MNETDAFELVQGTLWTIMLVSSPIVLPAMALGILIAFGQAITQIQEATLTFLPKMAVVFFALMLSGTFIAATLQAFADMLYDRIAAGF